MPEHSNVLFRWSLGTQDTTKLADKDLQSLWDMFWLAKISIISFQRWFPHAKFVLLYNGVDFDEFVSMFSKIEPPLLNHLEYIDQNKKIISGELKNPYHFFPIGVWYKWVPFRLNPSMHEVSVDTDIVCINEPKTWYQWFDGEEPIIIAPERFSKTLINTAGEFHSHPVLKNKKPLNCGVVGHRACYDYSERFYEITQMVDLGRTHNSMFITEQGAINLWVYSLETDGVNHYSLDFQKNSWIRDFVYFMEKGVKVETVHATTWHKSIVQKTKNIFERKVLSENYSDAEFLEDILESVSSLGMFENYVLQRQLGVAPSTEYFFN